MHPDQDFDAKLKQYLRNTAHVIMEVFSPPIPLSACPSSLTLTKNIPGCFVMLMGFSQTFQVPCSPMSVTCYSHGYLFFPCYHVAVGEAEPYRLPALAHSPQTSLQSM